MIKYIGDMYQHFHIFYFFLPVHIIDHSSWSDLAHKSGQLIIVNYSTFLVLVRADQGEGGEMCPGTRPSLCFTKITQSKTKNNFTFEQKYFKDLNVLTLTVGI